MNHPHQSPRQTRKVAAGTAAALILAMAFIAPWEGSSLNAYQDGVKKWTVCRGHTAGVYKGMKATPAECEQFYESDTGEALEQTAAVISVPASDYELAAYTSFVFNAGIGNFRSSTMLKKLNAGDHVGACNQLLRWIYVGGKDCRDRANLCYGIVKRRAAERELCLTALN